MKEGNSPSKNALKIPDFRKYATNVTIKKINFNKRSVQVTWSDNLIHSYNRFWLRENAPDPQTTHPDSREQLLNLLKIPDSLSILKTEITNSGSLRVYWEPGKVISEYEPSWLRFWGENRLNLNLGLPKQILWKNFEGKGLPHVSWTEENKEGCLLKWLSQLKTYGVAILNGVGKVQGDLEKTLETFGVIRESNFGKIFDVKYDEDPISNAYTNIELPLHTDLCTRQHLPQYQFLHALENSCPKGESIVSDGFMLAQILKKKNYESFEALTEIGVRFLNKAEYSDYQWVGKVIGLNPKGEVQNIRLSPWLRGPVCGNEEQEEAFYQAFRTFMRLAEVSDLQEKVKLEPGDLLAFDNTRILHGRNEVGEGGRRWLRGCYMDGDEIDSTLRMGFIPLLSKNGKKGL